MKKTTNNVIDILIKQIIQYVNHFLVETMDKHTNINPTILIKISVSVSISVSQTFQRMHIDRQHTRD